MFHLGAGRGASGDMFRAAVGLFWGMVELRETAWFDLLIPVCLVLEDDCNTGGVQSKSPRGSGELGAMTGDPMSMSPGSSGELDGSGRASSLSGKSGGSRVPPSWKGPLSWEEAMEVVESWEVLGSRLEVSFSLKIKLCSERERRD